MKIGICCGLSDAARAVQAGLEYVELQAALLGAPSGPLPVEDYADVPMEATNVFFAPEIRLFGENATDWHDYAKRTVDRAASLEVKIMVLGSGRARHAPTAGAEYEERFADVAAWIDEYALRAGVRVAPESLNRTETNVGNDLASLARRLAQRGVGYTADSFHVLREWDADGREGGLPAPSPEFWQRQLPHTPLHVHLGDINRKAPRLGDPQMAGFFQRLDELGYNARMSFECSMPDDWSHALTEVLAR
jgi:sugar phosphate isomerase/epimerase